ncbi:glycosyltransferase [Denitratisoma sp. DHT3]|uniref:glycosyltransferase n=1 Tax=Denitratisoma sp. DHT3 TaxID=1981880 RepID=UPI001649251A|nr:glycosyltransferase [Denitratisoma sp. DHT3]
MRQFPSRLAAALDTPAAHRGEPGSILFSGWCVHPERRIVRLELAFGAVRGACTVNLPSPDVAAALPGWAGADACRFEIQLDVPAGVDVVHLIATLDDDDQCRWRGPHKFRFRPPGRIAVWSGKLKGAGRFLRFARSRAAAWRARHGRLPGLREIPLLVSKALALYRVQHAAAPTPGRLPKGYALPEPADVYDCWLAVNTWTAEDAERLRRRLDAATAATPLPLISVVMPVYRPPLEFLQKAIDSVRAQVYPHWELCIADDAGGDPAVERLLADAARDDPRIKVRVLDANLNISGATNAAAELAGGEFLAFLDNDDELSPDALGEVALHLAAHPDTDYLYSDDDKIDAAGNRFAPQFKAGWSPELLLSYMYCAHLVTVRRSLYQELGGMRIGFEGSQDYDFALRATEVARRVGHIPRMLYHWRVLPGSTATSGDAKPASFEAGRRAVEEALARRGSPAHEGIRVFRPSWAERGGLGIFWHDFPDHGPSVAILVPTRNRLDLLRRCLDSLKATTYRDYRVVIIDNESDDPKTLGYLARCGHEVLRIASPGGRFSFAHINNEAARRVDAEHLLFLNNDTEVVDPRWLSRMVGYARLAGVGAVGARLLYPDGRVQHGGIVHGYHHGMAGHAFKLLSRHDHGYLSQAMVARNCAAVTAACLLTPRALFLECGGFDEAAFAVAYNDVDYCYRLVDRGLRCVYAPGAELLHYEGLSRGFADNPAEEAAFRRKYAGRDDSWYSPHLSLEDEGYRLRARRLAPADDDAAPVRTLMTAFNLNLEGAPYSQYELTVALKRRGVIDPVVYCPEDGPLRRRYEDAGIEVRVFPHPLAGVFDLPAYHKAIDDFAAFLRRCGARLVYANTLQTFYTIAAARAAGLPSIWNPRESEPWETYFNHFGDAIAAEALRCFEYPYRVVFVAEATRRGCEALDTRHNFTVIHNGLDMERFLREAEPWPRAVARKQLAVADDDIVILLLGTVCERKGQLDLLQALARLPAQHHGRVRCLVVGDRPGPYSEALAQQVARLPAALRPRVALVPETHDTALYYRAADVFVCTSRIESYPRVILEAMAHGLPIVTTPVFGIPEQVREEVNALFYSPGNAAELCARLCRLLDDADLRRRLAAASPEVLALRTDFEEMANAYAEVFREASLTRPPRSSQPFTRR